MTRWTLYFFTIFLLLGHQSNGQTKDSVKTTLSSYKVSECLTNCSIKTEVISSKLTKGTLNLKVGAHLNCSVKGDSKITYTLRGDTLNIIVPEMQITRDSTITKTDSSQTIKITETKEHTLCKCFFHIELVINNCKKTPNTILINGLSFLDNYSRRTIIEQQSIGQTNDSIKYVNAIKYIQQDKEIDKYRDKYFFKKANKFRVSEHTIYNYHPLRYFDNHLDSLGINKMTADSLYALQKDTITTISFASKLSTEKTSDYILYFGKPIKNLMFVVIENDLNEKKDTKYYGLCCRPLIILLVFDTKGNVTKGYCSAPIIE